MQNGVKHLKTQNPKFFIENLTPKTAIVLNIGRYITLSCDLETLGKTYAVFLHKDFIIDKCKTYSSVHT